MNRPNEFTDSSSWTWFWEHLGVMPSKHLKLQPAELICSKILYTWILTFLDSKWLSYLKEEFHNWELDSVLNFFEFYRSKVLDQRFSTCKLKPHC